MLKRLPVRDRTLTLAFLIAATIYGAKVMCEATTANRLMVDKAPVVCDGAHTGCVHPDATSLKHRDTDQVG